MFKGNAPMKSQEALFAPTLVSPKHESASMTPPSHFIWNAVENADSYHIQITTDVTFLDINTATTDIDIAAHGDTLYSPPADFLDTDTMYFWHVKARSHSGAESDWSYTQMFLTGVNSIYSRIAAEAITVAPLPISSFAVISFDNSVFPLFNATELQVFVFSAAGRLVDKLIYENFSPAVPVELYVDKYFSGAYYLVFTTNNKVLGMKQVVVK